MNISKFNLNKDSLFFIIAVSFFLIGFLQYSSFLEVDKKTILSATLGVPILIMYILAEIFGKKALKWTALIGAIFIWVILPTILLINLRLKTQPFLYVHDNPIQIEEAIKFLEKGENPYGQDYSKTILGKWPYYRLKTRQDILTGSSSNPSLYHVVSLPFGLVGMMPIFIVWHSMFGWFDARIFYLALYILSLVLATSLVSKESRFNFLAIFSLNPFLALFIPEGRNDIFTIFLMVLALVLIKKGKFLLSSVPIGLAVATKQSAWVFLIVFTIFLFYRFLKKDKLLIFQCLAISLSIAISFILPFLLWNPQAFIDDTIKYVSGGLSTSYPISGFGFSMLLSKLGLVKDDYPTTFYQLIFGLPTLILIAFLLKHKNTLQTLVFSFSLLLLVLLYFSRFFADNYFGVVLQFLILAYFLPKQDETV